MIVETANNKRREIEKYCSEKGNSEEDSRRMININVMIALERQVCRMKHGAYFQERETRIIIEPRYRGAAKRDRIHDLPIKLRSNKRGLVPYVELQIPNCRKVYVGPSENQKMNKHALTLWCDEINYQEEMRLQIELENIPFRG